MGVEIIFRPTCRARTAITAFALVIACIIQSGCQRNEIAPINDPLAAFPWLYLRDGKPVTDSEQVVTLIAVGDIQLGRDVPNPSQAFEEVTGWLSQADLTMGNMEGTLAPTIQDTGNELEQTAYTPILLSAEPEAANWLSQAGFDVLSLANNHASDAGPQGLAATVQLLQDAGLKVIGAQQQSSSNVEPLVIEKDGIRLVFLAVNTIPVPPSNEQMVSGNGLTTESNSGWVVTQWDKDKFLATIQSARAQADILIVSVHWGYEYQSRVDPAQEWIAEALLQSGADIIIGHHPHVIQTSQVLTYDVNEAKYPDTTRTKLIAYSLGNFVFDQGQEQTNEGQALRLYFDQEGLRAAQSLPIAAGTRPQLLPPSTVTSQIDVETSPPIEVAAFACDDLDCTSVTLTDKTIEEMKRTESGIFTSGVSDLTGDAKGEKVMLEGGQITVLQDGQVRWQSPIEWQVVDLATGDLDRDGRQDILAAFWKSDPDGIRRSHPFLIRQQGGRYQEVWGGSAVSDPILEVEAGDLNGDGLDELIVLEQHPQSLLQAVTVWRWHGWGFSLAWRSPEGHYENLKINEYEGKKIITTWKR